MAGKAPYLRRTWLFGPGADPAAHQAMIACGADVVIVDLEDFTPPGRRQEARQLLPGFVRDCRAHGRMPAIRINMLEDEGMDDLAVAMATRPDMVVYPMAERVSQLQALDVAMTHWEGKLGIEAGSTEILPCCETALGVVEVRSFAAATKRIRAALLGVEDLVADLRAERTPSGTELDYARRLFILECRAAKIEPIDAPYTYSDTEGATRETQFARMLGYHCKAIVRPEHAATVNGCLTPSAEQVAHASAIVAGFEAARERGEDRVLVEGLWVEVPTYRNARRLIELSKKLCR